MKPLKVGDSARFTRSDRDDTAIGVVREVTARQIIVWFGDTGFGQKRWPFSAKDGSPIGLTKIAFPTGLLDLSWRSPFAEDDTSG
jgi:hypothetical protein